MTDFFSGVLTLGYAMVGLFFLRFWKRSADALFAYLAVAFWILAGQRLALSVMREFEHDIVFYIARLIAFLLILFAILNKNMGNK